MYSNFITPPDIVDEVKPNIIVINADEKEVELLVLFAQHSDKYYNIYLYQDSMQDTKWLDTVVQKCDAVIMNDANEQHHNLLKLDKTYYYGSKNYICPATKVKTVLDYFNLQ